jgi:hypothetical protein
MSEIANIPLFPSLPPRTEIRETQPAPAGAQLSQVEEEVFNENANSLATHRAATGIFGRPPTNFIYRSTPGFGKGQHMELLQVQRNAFPQPTAPINPGFSRGQHREIIQAQRNALAQPTAPINQHSEFIQAQRNAYGHYSAPINQEVVRQNESASYYLEASAATLPSDSDAAANLDLVTRGKLDAHDAYDAASAAFVDKFMHDNYFTSLDDIGQAIDALNAIEDLYDLATGDPDKPTDEPAPVRRSHLNGDTVGDTKGGHRGDTAPTPAAAGTQTANRPRRQSAGASAAPNPPHAGRGGGQPDAA